MSATAAPAGAPGSRGRAAAVLLVAGLGVPGLLTLALLFRANQVPHDVALDYLTGLFWSGALAGVLAVLPFERRERAALLWIWAAKVGVAMGFMLLYESFYTSLDANAYFAASYDRWAEVAPRRFGDGTALLAAASWGHARVFGHSHHAFKVTCAFVGLIACHAAYRAWISLAAHRDVRVLYVLSLTPSVLFWSSIPGKDPLTLLGITLSLSGTAAFVTGRRRTSAAIELVAGVVLASAVRIWLLPILVGPLAVLWMLTTRSLLVRTAIVTSMVAAGVIGSRMVLALMAFDSVDDGLRYVALAAQLWAEDGGSGRQLPVDLSSPGGVALFLPLGMFTALFRPLPGEVLNPFGLLAGLESLGLLGLAAWTALRGDRARWRPATTWWLIALVVAWSGIYAFISYQNAGSAVRFRLQILPVLLLLAVRLTGFGETPDALSGTEDGAERTRPASPG